MKVTKEEAEFVEKSLAEFRAKKQLPTTEAPKEQELDLKEAEKDESLENECASCGWKFNGNPERCPQCETELEWSN